MADIFSVIADPTRREILSLLLAERETDAEMRVSDLVEKLEISQPTVSKHLKVLREAELVAVREDGQSRYYSLEAGPLGEVEDFVMPFLMSDVDTEVSVDYLDAHGSVVDVQPLVNERARSAAENVGRAAGAASHQVKQLVAKFKLR